MNILITGTTSGIGLEILNHLKKDKENKFFLISRKLKKNLSIKNIRNYKLDLSNIELLKKKIKLLLKDANNKIDLIICNAGQGIFGDVQDINLKQYQKVMNINFYSHLLIIKSIIPIMRKQKFGHIVNIASGAGIVGLEKTSSYSISKSCMQILIESMHKELSKYNIFPKNIFPGATKTNFSKKNIYIKHKAKTQGKDVKKISSLIIQNLFKKKVNIFCQKKTMASFIIKAFPSLI
jgi:short-subunit dehydrogenase